MAFSAHKDADEVTEYVTDQETLDAQATELAQYIKDSRHMIAFTGAGVSTSAGISDFRGPKGVWTLRAQGKVAQSKTSTSQAIPTATHMALVTLQREHMLKFLISQNTDGLHRRSGMATDCLAELHGNSNLDVCRKCGREYLRDFRVRRKGNGVHDHQTERDCVCGSPLYDTIINFNENLPPKPLNDGFLHSKQSDLCLVLGSSLRVTPAADMPRDAKKKGAKLVICNLQKTPLDGICDLRIYARTDDLMRLVMEKLSVPIMPWVLRRHVLVKSTQHRLTVAGVEADGIPASIFRKIKIKGGDKTVVVEQPELEVVFASDTNRKLQSASITLSFFGHYNEPDLKLRIECDSIKEKHETFQMIFEPAKGVWQPAKLVDSDL